MFLQVFTLPGPFSCLVFHLSWSDLRSILSTAKLARELFHHPTHFDLLLSRFVPSFRPFPSDEPVTVQISDLDLFLSQNRSNPVSLALVHSKFVLLLQSRVHSQPRVLPPEQPLFEPSPNLHLTIPAPLSYCPKPNRSPRSNFRRLSSTRPSPSSALSPLDFSLAAHPSRAPILTTFVPCHSLHPHILHSCEEQLISAHLWSSLSVGDIITNLGHVTDKHHWLIYNGQNIIFFSKLVPLPNPLSLPSPFYFSHITTNPIFSLDSMPPFKPLPSPLTSPLSEYLIDGLTLQLVTLPTNVPVSKPNILLAVISQYAWIARVFVDAIPIEIGLGWQAEWVLQSEGTKEGKHALLSWLRRSLHHCKLQLVQERCSPGLLWLKLIDDHRKRPVKLDGDGNGHHP